ncbi:MAG: hypothetical protein ACLR23_01725 [Clostridia bacterium]
MEGKQIVTLIFLVAFVAIMVGIGLLSMKRTKTVGGFLLGGRKMGAWMSAFAYGTSYFPQSYLSATLERMGGISAYPGHGLGLEMQS